MRNINGHTAIWKHRIGEGKFSIPIFPIENRWSSIDVSPGDRYMIFTSQHSGENTVYVTDLSNRESDQIHSRTLKNIDILIDKEKSKFIAYKFISEAIINKNFKIVRKIIADNSNLIHSISGRSSWHKLLREISNTNKESFFSKEISMRRLYGGVENDSGTFIADLSCKIASEHLAIKLKKYNNVWKIQSIKNRWK